MGAKIRSKEFFTDAVRTTRETDEGWLVGEVNATACGVFAYPGRGDGGSTMFLLRHPTDVFNQRSAESGYLKPVIIWHPRKEVAADGMLDVDNIGDAQVGTLGERHTIDGTNLVYSFTITRKDGVDAVKSGLNAVSMGRDAVVIRESGNYHGQAYTHRELECVYNHMALVDKGRMGPDAKIYLDRLDADEIENKGTRMRKILLDGIEYDAAPQVVNALEKERQGRVDDKAANKVLLDAAVSAKETAEGTAAGLQTKLDAALLDASEAPKKAREAAKARQALEGRAKKLGLSDADMETMVDNDETAVMRKAILAKNPKAKLTDKDSKDYVKAMFDLLSEDDEAAANESLEDRHEPVHITEARRSGGRPSTRESLSDAGENDPVKAFEDLTNKDLNAWKTKTP